MNLETTYYDNHPFSYGSRQTLLKHLVTGSGNTSDDNDDDDDVGQEHKASKSEIDEFLLHSDVYSKFRQFRSPQTFNPIYVYRKRQLFQCDAVFFTTKPLVKANNGYKYLLTIIDCATKFTWNYPLRSLKCSEEVLSKFEHLFQICGKPPEKIQTDKGSEFKCKELAELFNKFKIHHYYSYSDRKCSIVERYNLTIQTLIYKMMERYNSFEWTKFLPRAVNIYHKRIHRTIKMSPTKAELDSSQSELIKIHKARYSKVQRKKPKFKKGDSVRIASEKTKFKRGYLQHFNDEVFVVDEVLDNLPLPRYVLADDQGTQLVGTFFENEITHFKPKADQLWRIEKILKERRKAGGRGGKEYLVKWVGHDPIHNSWVDESQIESI